MKKLSPRFFVYSFLVCAMAIGCATSGFNQGDLNVVTYDQERAWGEDLKREIDAQARQQGMDYHDPVVIDYVNRLGHRVLSRAPEVKFNYTFSVIKSDVANAFAIPGGHVYVYTGLIAQLQNEAQLAGIIGHEIGHCVARHATERMSTMIIASYAGSILIGTQTGTEAELSKMAMDLLLNSGYLAYTRSAEREADELGVRMMHEAGYNPKELANFFMFLVEQHGTMNGFEEFMSTHPDSLDRRGAIAEYVNSHNIREDLLIRDTPEFQKIKKICKNLHPNANRTDQQYKKPQRQPENRPGPSTAPPPRGGPRQPPPPPPNRGPGPNRKPPEPNWRGPGQPGNEDEPKEIRRSQPMPD